MVKPRANQTFLNLFCPVAIALVALLACLPMIVFGASNGHSLPLNLMWLREFSGQLMAGELYPRWLFGMNGGAGSPAFFFYSPFSFYVVSLGPILCLICKPTIQLALGEWLLLALSGFSFYVFAKRGGGILAATAGAIIYMLLPYHFEIDLWQRQAIAEFAAYIWIPLPFLFIDKMSKGENGVGGLAISYGLLIFTHLPSALLLSPFLAIYAGLLSLRDQSPILVAKFVAGLLLGVLISSIYLLPALLTQDYISSQFWWSTYFEYDRWFFLDGLDEPNARFGNRLFYVLVISSSIFMLLWLAAYPCLKENRITGLLLPCVFMSLAWFLMSPASRPAWELFPILQKIQFPWRVAIVMDLVVAMTAVHAMGCISRKRRRISLALAGVAMILFVSVVVSGVWANRRSLDLYKSPEYLQQREYRIKSARDATEYFPAWVKLTPKEAIGAIASMDMVNFDHAKGRVQLTRSAPREIAMDVDLSEQTELVVRQFFYPGWRAEMTGRIPLEIEPTETTGLIKMVAPAGQYRLSLELAPLREEVVGAILSGLGLLIVFLSAIPRALRFQRLGVKNRKPSDSRNQ